jgi:hypothetical protein
MKHRGVLVAGGFALLALQAFAPASARAQPLREVSRSSPIVATLDGGEEIQYQGSYETPLPPVTTFNGAADAATFVFPAVLGHVRAVRTADITTAEVAFKDLVAVFDTGNPLPTSLIPPVPGGGVCATPFGDTCRTVFTTVAAPDAAGLASRPPRVPFDASNDAALQPLLAPALSIAETDSLIGLVLQGVPDGAGRVSRLGGIDRSTVALIEKSPFIPQIAGVDRPAMIYVGALDGMLHAICAEVRGPCTAAGRELWAFIPRTQLGALHTNTQRIDGSVKVADVFDDFDPIDGVREFRTVLTLQTGSGDPATTNGEPSVVAIDISNPADPIVLWERTAPAAPPAIAQGVGLTLAMAPVRVGGVARNFTFVQTNNGGSGGSGFYLGAIDTVSGAEAWAFTGGIYPAPRSGANPPVPDTGIPGGAAALSIDQSGFATHVMAASLYGDLWVFDAATGVNPNTNKPLFRFSSDFHPIGAPPTVYADLATSRMYAVVVSGGYADPVATTWVQPTDSQFVVSVAVDAPPASTPFDETGAASDERPIAFALPAGQRVTGQAIVAGNDLFVASDSTDANLASFGQTPGTGTLTRFSLTTRAVLGTGTGIAGGGSSVDVSRTGMVAVGSGGGAMKFDASSAAGGFDAGGVAIEESGEDTNKRLLWLHG